MACCFHPYQQLDSPEPQVDLHEVPCTANVENDESDRSDHSPGVHHWRGDTVAAAADLEGLEQTGDAEAGQIGDAD